jgi:hypothetical protein
MKAERRLYLRRLAICCVLLGFVCTVVLLVYVGSGLSILITPVAVFALAPYVVLIRPAWIADTASSTALALISALGLKWVFEGGTCL